MRKPFVRVAIHHGTCEVPDDEAETCEGMRVWELPCLTDATQVLAARDTGDVAVHEHAVCAMGRRLLHQIR